MKSVAGVSGKLYQFTVRRIDVEGHRILFSDESGDRTLYMMLGGLALMITIGTRLGVHSDYLAVAIPGQLKAHYCSETAISVWLPAERGQRLNAFWNACRWDVGQNVAEVVPWREAL